MLRNTIVVATMLIGMYGGSISAAEPGADGSPKPPNAAAAAPSSPAPASKSAPSGSKFTRQQQEQLDEAARLNSQVVSLWKAGRSREALPLAIKALEIRKRVLGAEHPDYAVSLHNLGAQCESIGDYAKAEQAFREACDVRKRVLGEEHRDYASSASTLGHLYWLTGEFTKAEPLFLKASEIRKKVLGEHHPEYARNLNNLGHLYEAKRDFAKAEVYFTQARDIRKRTLGDSHPDYIQSVNDLTRLDQARAKPTLSTPPDSGSTQAKRGAAHDLSAEDQKRLEWAGQLNDRVYELNQAYKFREALPLAQEELRIRQELLGSEHPGTALSHFNVAAQYAGLNEYAKAEPHYLQAMAIWKKAHGDDHPDYATSLSGLAKLYDSMGEHTKAEPLYLQALAIQKKVLGEEHADYARSLSRLAILYSGMAEYAKAEPLYLQAKAILKKTVGEQHRDYATSLNDLAILYYTTAEYGKAEPLYRQAIVTRRKVLGEEHPQYADSLNGLALLYDSMGDFAKAEPLFLQAMATRKKVLGEEHPDYAASLSNLAGLYTDMGEFAKAEPLSLQAMAIRKKVLGEEHPDYASSLNGLASLYYSMADYAKAEQLFLRALAIRKKAGGEEHADYANSLHNLASLYHAMGEYAKAELFYRQAMAVTKKVLGEEHPDYANSLDNLAGLYEVMGEYKKAEPICLQAMAIRKKALGEGHPSYATSLISLALLYHCMGKYAKAEPYYLQAITIQKEVLGEEHPRYATSLHNLSRLYELSGERQKAELLARELLRREQIWANRILSSLPEARAANLQQKLYGCGPLLRALRPSPDRNGSDAYEGAWQTRAPVTRMLLERRKAIAGTPEAQAILANLQTTSQELAQLVLAVPKPEQHQARQTRLVELNDRKEHLETELAKVSAEFRRSLEVSRSRPKDLVGLLRNGIALVDFCQYMMLGRPTSGRGRDIVQWHYDAFVVRAGADSRSMIHWVPLGPSAPIDEALNRWRQDIVGKVASRTATRPEVELRQRLWDMVEPHLDGCSTVIVVPDGQLCFLPWAALPGREPGTVLLEDYALATVPSSHQLYATLTERPRTADKLLLVGGVSYESAAAGPTLLAAEARSRSPATTGRLSWAALPGTEREIDVIARLWPGRPSQRESLCGEIASETALRNRLPGSRYIHLATHGFFADEKFRSMFGHDLQGEQLFGGSADLVTGRRAQATARNPLVLSGVVLAGANLPPKTDSLGLPTGDDGILTAEEIVNLDLRGTELAVLSACDTGLGNVAGGEGVMGLTRAFHLAGARNVVASLWKVDDEATAALMKLFYQKLWRENKPPAVALQQAQLAIYHNPDLIKQLSGNRGAGFKEDVELINKGRRDPGGKTTHPRLWAAWVLSGPGQ